MPWCRRHARPCLSPKGLSTPLRPSKRLNTWAMPARFWPMPERCCALTACCWFPLPTGLTTLRRVAPPDPILSTPVNTITTNSTERWKPFSRTCGCGHRITPRALYSLPRSPALPVKYWKRARRPGQADERLEWVRGVEAELSAARAHISVLDQTILERTDWARSLESEKNQAIQAYRNLDASAEARLQQAAALLAQATERHEQHLRL